jgi:hypothetical protein
MLLGAAAALLLTLLSDAAGSGVAEAGAAAPSATQVGCCVVVVGVGAAATAAPKAPGAAAGVAPNKKAPLKPALPDAFAAAAAANGLRFGDAVVAPNVGGGVPLKPTLPLAGAATGAPLPGAVAAPTAGAAAGTEGVLRNMLPTDDADADVALVSAAGAATAGAPAPPGAAAAGSAGANDLRQQVKGGHMRSGAAQRRAIVSRAGLRHASTAPRATQLRERRTHARVRRRVGHRAALCRGRRGPALARRA